MNTELKIDPKFKNLIPPLSHEEFDLLEQSCLAEGIRDAIVTWQGFIIDGHNRYSIAQKHGLEVRTVEKDIATDADVIDWMINNQLGKRNISEEQKSYLRGKRYENEKNKQAFKGNQYTSGGGNSYQKQTSETLADELNVSEKTIRNDAQFATGVDALPEVERKQVLQGKSKLTKKDVQSIGKAKTEAKKEVEKNAFFISEEEKEAEIARRAEELAAQRLAEIKEEKKRKNKSKLKEIQDENKRRDSEGIGKKPIASHEDVCDFLSRFEDGSVDLLFTDPPYSTDVDDLQAFLDRWLYLALDKVKRSGRAFICIGAYPKELQAYLNMLLDYDGWIVDNPLIWTYRNALGITPKMKYNLNYQVILHLYRPQSRELNTSITNEMFSVQDINAPDGRQGDRYHAWQKPSELAKRLISHSMQKGEKMIDPFCCTGTFLVEAGKLGMEAHGSDINIKNLKIAYERGCAV